MNTSIKGFSKEPKQFLTTLKLILLSPELLLIISEKNALFNSITDNRISAYILSQFFEKLLNFIHVLIVFSRFVPISAK